MESLLTRFTKDDPCWTEELFALVGEDTAPLSSLVADGLLEESGGIYSLTEAGTAAFRAAAATLFIEEEPGAPSASPAKDIFRTKLRLLLDGSHVQRWGIKEFKTQAALPFLPDIEIAPHCAGDSLKWGYEENPIYRAMQRDFPIVTLDVRATDMLSREQIEAWAKKNGAAFDELDVDLLYLCRYDFMQYKEFPGHPNDPLRLINTDRFLFVMPEEETCQNLAVIGEFHLWLNYLRRMQIPGYVDRDTQEQDSVSWLVFAVETEEEAQKTADALSPYGEALVKNANPCEVWTLSLEALEQLDAKRELVWELLPDIAHPVQRTLL